MNKHNERAELISKVEDLAKRFSAGWHDGINIDADDIATLCEAAALLEAQPAAVPDGYALVPVEPTPEMRKAGIMVAKMDVTGAWVTDAEDAYRAMLAAAPNPQ